jgi:hypothetical protein
MGKLAQYRFLKLVKKMLDTPAKQEEIYDVSAAPMYIGGKSSRNRNHGTNPNRSLRQQQVSGIASDLLLQINRIEKMLQHDHGAVNEGDMVAVDNVFLDFAITLSELDAGILFTDAEKAARRQQLASRGVMQEASDQGCDDLAELDLLRFRIEKWQLEKTKRQKRVERVEIMIRDLDLNVNDVRCTPILNDKNKAVASLEAAVNEGARLCRHVCAKLGSMYGRVKE